MVYFYFSDINNYELKNQELKSKIAELYIKIKESKQRKNEKQDNGNFKKQKTIKIKPLPIKNI